MNSITVNKISPNFISDSGITESEIWFNDLTFEKGLKYLITAESGKGKSSLLSYIFGERNDFDGDILFDGKKHQSLKANEWTNIRTHNISVVFQGLKLFNELTLIENINLKNSITNCKTNEQILQMIEIAGLTSKINQKVKLLSFGQQQRAAVIRAMCQPFDFLLMDEPFSHLDERNVEIITTLTEKEMKERNAALILCSLGPKYLFNYNKTIKL